MKKACLAAVFMSSAVGANAQSAVTLYGTVDNGITYTNNQSGHRNIQASNGALGSSKWGFLIKEDLGGGYSALARLENGFDINRGTLNNGGRLFGRQAYVGVGSPFGTVTMGRQYDLVLDSLIGLSASSRFGGILAAHAADVDNVWGDYSLSNSVKYVSPNYAGFKVSALFSFGGVPGDFSNGKKESVSLSYARDALSAAVVFSRIDNPATSIYDASAAPVAGGTFVDPITNPIFSGYTSARALQVAGAGINYRLGQALVGFTYTNTRFENVVRTSSTPFSGTATFNNFEALATYNVTPAFMLGTSCDYTKAETAKYLQLNAGALYNLSKRTLLYATTSWEHATGIDSTGKAAVAALTFLTPSSTGNQVAVRAGIRHNF
ncbi:porin [Burkholderia vietnamiensis]|jgi:predicted porin|uniref:porin n=1 Tax=Burkholderia vietnamiensis TaxID=60552 RepID=UPI0007594FB9|nr:porin [Burkholderia vietnamiensis]KVE66091.1 porin [Burkholderia vietnamiensis]KVE98270.1 porin [Burkholderia vietnamiensis]